MSLRLSPLASPITIELDGKSVPAKEGEPVAVSLLAAGETLFSRSSKYHRPRGAYCFSGGCAQCLMRVDGRPNVQTCREPARAGMVLERQNAFPSAEVDVFAATDVIFRDWFNHHEFMAGVPIAEPVLLRLTRMLSGLGKLPDRTAPLRHPAVVERCAVAVVGGGAAGLAAARFFAEHAVPFVLFEHDDELGGRLTATAEEGAPLVYDPPAASVRTGATVVGLYADAGPRFLLVLQGDRLHVVYPERVLLAHGGQPSLMTFESNDLPGLYAGRAVARLVRRHGVLPGRRVAVVGEAQEAQALARLLEAHGAQAVAVGAEPVRAHGLHQVSSLIVRSGGQESRVDCDAVALCGPLTPAYELARAAGARVEWNAEQQGFEVHTDEQLCAVAPDVYTAGEARSPCSAAIAAAQGLAAAKAIAASLEQATKERRAAP